KERFRVDSRWNAHSVRDHRNRESRSESPVILRLGTGKSVQAGRSPNISSLRDGRVDGFLDALIVESPRLQHAVGGNDIGFLERSCGVSSRGSALLPKPVD